MLCFRSSAPEMCCISPQNYFHPVVLGCDTKTFSTAGLVPRNLRVLGWQNTGVCGCKFPPLPDSTSQFSVFFRTKLSLFTRKSVNNHVGNSRMTSEVKIDQSAFKMDYKLLDLLS